MITVKRDYFPNYTYGVWYRDNQPLGIYSIELPNLDNQHDTSCIPEGEYKVTLYNSATKGIVYLLHDVPNRTFIEIHKGNFTSDVLGCFAVGLSFGVMINPKTKKGEAAVLNSSGALTKLMALCNNAEFQLTVTT